MSNESAQPQSERTAQRTVLRNTLVGMGTGIIMRVANLIFMNILVINTIGSAEYGKYSIVLAWAVLFSVIGDLGVTQYLTREIARDKERIPELFWNTAALRFVLAIVCSIITTGGAVIAGYEPDIVAAVALYTATYFLQAILQPLVALLTGYERLDVVSIYMMIWQVLIMILSLLFLFLGFNFQALVIAQLAVLPIMLVLHYRAIRKAQIAAPPFKLNPRLWWMIIRGGLPFAFTQLSLSFALRADTVLLSLNKVSNSEVGFYGIAYSLTIMLLSLAQNFSNAILPTLARQHAENPDSVRNWYFSSVRGMLFFTLPIAVGGTLTASAITQLLYEPEIAPAAIPLAILVWSIPLSTYHAFSGNIANSMRREGLAARIFMSLGFINILLNLLLIPRFGIIGASFATVTTDFSGAALFFMVLRREFGAGMSYSRIARLGLAAAMMGVVLYILHDLNFLILLPIGALVYLIIVWVARAFNDQERGWLVGIITRRLRPRAVPLEATR